MDLKLRIFFAAQAVLCFLFTGFGTINCNSGRVETLSELVQDSSGTASENAFKQTEDGKSGVLLTEYIENPGLYQAKISYEITYITTNSKLTDEIYSITHTSSSLSSEYDSVLINDNEMATENIDWKNGFLDSEVSEVREVKAFVISESAYFPEVNSNDYIIGENLLCTIDKESDQNYLAKVSVLKTFASGMILVASDEIKKTTCEFDQTEDPSSDSCKEEIAVNQKVLFVRPVCWHSATADSDEIGKEKLCSIFAPDVYTTVVVEGHYPSDVNDDYFKVRLLENGTDENSATRYVKTSSCSDINR